jgi:hypothetical protein
LRCCRLAAQRTWLFGSLISILLGRWRLVRAVPAGINFKECRDVKDLISHCFPLAQTSHVFAMNFAHEPGVPKIIIDV